jgi:hypothetical protein
MINAKKLVAGIDYPRTLQEFDVFSQAKKPVVIILCNFVGPKAANALHVAPQKHLG